MVPTCVWLSMLTCSMAASYPYMSIMVNPTEGILVRLPRLHIQNVLLASREAQKNNKADTSEDGLIMANVPFVEFLKTKQTIIPPYMPPTRICMAWCYTSFRSWLHEYQTGNNTSLSAAKGFPVHKIFLL